MTARWYSSWILFSAFIPLVIMYSVWIPLSCAGRLRRRRRRQLVVPNAGAGLNSYKYGSDKDFSLNVPRSGSGDGSETDGECYLFIGIRLADIQP